MKLKFGVVISALVMLAAGLLITHAGPASALVKGSEAARGPVLMGNCVSYLITSKTSKSTFRIYYGNPRSDFSYTRRGVYPYANGFKLSRVPASFPGPEGFRGMRVILKHAYVSRDDFLKLLPRSTQRNLVEDNHNGVKFYNYCNWYKSSI